MDTAVLTPIEPVAPPAPDLLDSIVLDSRVARGEAEHGRARELIVHLAHEVSAGTVAVSENLGLALDARIAELDELISTQLSEILHHPRFQRLEAAWTGLHYLCRHAAGGPQQRIAIFDATRQELVRDFSTAVDFDQSALFRKVYEEAFGSFGGAPFGALVGDYEIGRGAEDLYLVEQMSHVAAAAHAPFLAAASPELLGLDSFADIGRPRRHRPSRRRSRTGGSGSGCRPRCRRTSAAPPRAGRGRRGRSRNRPPRAVRSRRRRGRR